MNLLATRKMSLCHMRYFLCCQGLKAGLHFMCLACPGTSSGELDGHLFATKWASTSPYVMFKICYSHTHYLMFVTWVQVKPMYKPQ